MSLYHISAKQLQALLPSEITCSYSIDKLLCLNSHSAVLSVISNYTKEKYAIKILEKCHFNKQLYHKITQLKHPFILLPDEIYHNQTCTFLLYPQKSTLTEFLSTKHFTFSTLCQLVHDIGNAILALHQKNILHLDITPNNIFWDTKGHFLLGDFSSSRIRTAFFSRSRHSPQTGTTPYFAPAMEEEQTPTYFTDCYSFSKLLFILTNHGDFSEKDNDTVHHSFHSLHTFLRNKMQDSFLENKYIMQEFLLEIEPILEYCKKDINCQNYYLQLNETQRLILSEATVELPKDRNSYKAKAISRVSHDKSHHQLPVTAYGILISCGLIFLFSLYHYLSDTAFVANTEFTNADTLPDTPLLPTTSPNLIKAAPSANKEPVILNLTSTKYSDNDFTRLLTSQPSPQILIANHCQIESCHFLSDITKVKELYLSDNHIHSIKELTLLTDLEVLVLSKNRITDLSGLTKLTSITTLDLSHNNNLTHISSLARLKNLKFLILTNTNITQKEAAYLQKKLPHCTVFY